MCCTKGVLRGTRNGHVARVYRLWKRTSDLAPQVEPPEATLINLCLRARNQPVKPLEVFGPVDHVQHVSRAGSAQDCKARVFHVNVDGRLQCAQSGEG